MLYFWKLGFFIAIWGFWKADLCLCQKSHWQPCAARASHSVKCSIFALVLAPCKVLWNPSPLQPVRSESFTIQVYCNPWDLSPLQFKSIATREIWVLCNPSPLQPVRSESFAIQVHCNPWDLSPLQSKSFYYYIFFHVGVCMWEFTSVRVSQYVTVFVSFHVWFYGWLLKNQFHFALSLYISNVNNM